MKKFILTFLTLTSALAAQVTFSLDNVDTTGANIGDVPTFNGTKLVFAAPSGGTGGSSNWGAIGGTITNQSDLISLFNGKANTSHTHTASQISNASTVGLALIVAADQAAARLAIGLNNVANVDTTNAANITSGQLALGRFPSGTALQVLRRNSINNALEFASAGTGDVLAANNGSDFANAATTRSNLGAAAKSQAGIKLIGLGFDGGGAAIQTGKSIDGRIDQASTVTSVVAFLPSGDTTHTVTLSVQKNGTTVSGSTPVALSSGNSVTITDFSGYSGGGLTFTAGDRCGITTTGSPTATHVQVTFLGSVTLQ